MKMDSDEPSPNPHRPWFTFWILVGAIGLLAAWLSIPNFAYTGPAKISEIINHLRQIEAAKEEWALVNGMTNSLQLNSKLTPNDLSPYLLASFTNGNFGDPICGEIYSIQRLNESAQVRLTRDLREHGWPKNWTLPKGTIIKMGTNGFEEYFVPYPGSEFPKLLNEARTNK